MKNRNDTDKRSNCDVLVEEIFYYTITGSEHTRLQYTLNLADYRGIPPDHQTTSLLMLVKDVERAFCLEEAYIVWKNQRHAFKIVTAAVKRWFILRNVGQTLKVFCL